MKKGVKWQHVAVGAMFLGMAGIGSAQAQSYQGTAYVAGMGGHFAVADLTIDPSAAEPIAVNSLDKMDIGTRPTHPVHDARIDPNQKQMMYWSTYLPDKSADGMLHVGKSNLATGKIEKDVTVKIPDGTLFSGANYCASGQTKDYFLPISMAKPGYVSVIRKSDMKLMHNVYLEGTEADIKAGYKFIHGNTSPDMKELYLAINESNAPASDKGVGDTIGKMHLVVLDTAALEKGQVKVLRKGMVDGNAKSTIGFRAYYSPDGKYIANASADLLHIIDAKTLKTVSAATVGPLEQLHDATFTPDGKYVIATSRTKAVFPECIDPEKPKDDEFLMDGQLKLFDVKANKFIGKGTSTCLACHDQAGMDEHAILCGLDVSWK
jgi:hypothetical protein